MPGRGREVAVLSTKFDGSFHRRQAGWLVERRGSLIVLWHRAGVPVELARGPWLPTTDSLTYYWTDRWYIVYRRLDEAGHLRGWYCNIGTPVEFDGRTIRYMDLDLDIVVRPDGSYRLLDEEEFEANARLLHYPARLVQGARAAVRELLELLEQRAFPFDAAGLTPPASAQTG